MAMVTTVTVYDDLDGSPAQESVEFALDGIRYEIDLSAQNAAKLRRALARFIANSRKATPGPDRPVSVAQMRRRSQQELAAMREWARQEGWPIGVRGRVSAQIQRAYSQAHS